MKAKLNDRGLYVNDKNGHQYACYRWMGNLDSLFDLGVWIGAQPFITILPGHEPYSLILPDTVQGGENAGEKIQYVGSRIVYKGDWICWGDFEYRVVDKDTFKKDFKVLGRPF